MDSGISAGKTKLRLVRPDEIRLVESLYSECRKALAQKGSDQWQDGYPSTKDILQDIGRGCLWALPDLSGVGALNQDQDVQHKRINWQAGFETCRYIHRLAVDPSHWGKGLGKTLTLALEQQALKEGAGSIRLDTYSLNKANLNFYSRLGYTRLEGEVYFEPHDSPFICFEKLL